MNDLFQHGVLILLGTVLVVLAGIFLIQELGLIEPVTVHFVVPFQYDARGMDEKNLDDEYFTLRNLSKDPVDMSEWTVTNRAGDTFVFPEGFVLPSQAQATVFTGCGIDTESELHWCSEGPIWNNRQDAATLRDVSGEVVDTHTYSHQCIGCI